MVQIRADDYVDPDGVIVKSGELLGRRVVGLLRAGEPILIQLRGLAGISSSYFNALLRTVRDELGAGALDSVRMDFVSPLQRQVFERSLNAVRQDASQERVSHADSELLDHRPH